MGWHLATICDDKAFFYCEGNFCAENSANVTVSYVVAKPRSDSLLAWFRHSVVTVVVPPQVVATFCVIFSGFEGLFRRASTGFV